MRVLFSEDDYVCSQAGSRRADYDKGVANATQCSVDELLTTLDRLAGERRLDKNNPQLMLALTREIMRARYDAELRNRRRARA